MKSRIHLRRKLSLLHFKTRKINIIFLFLIIIIITIILVFRIISRKVSPTILDYAESEARKIASVMISSAINKNVANNIDLKELFVITKDSKGEINTIDFDSRAVNKILVEVTEIIQNNLKSLEKGNIENLDIPTTNYLSSDEGLKRGIIFEIPSGVIFNNAFLSNLGPKIPVKLNLVGDILSGISTNVTNYGINNALVEVKINLTIIEQIILPISSGQIKIETSVPIALKLIQGTVPNYYLNGINQNSSVLGVPVQ